MPAIALREIHIRPRQGVTQGMQGRDERPVNTYPIAPTKPPHQVIDPTFGRIQFSAKIRNVGHHSIDQILDPGRIYRCDPDAESSLNRLSPRFSHRFLRLWPAPGSEDTKFGMTMGPEVGHGEAEVYAGVQA